MKSMHLFFCPVPTALGFAALIATAALSLTACNPEEIKYASGPDDPSLRVTQEDIAQVEEVLMRQEEIDRAKGLLPPASEVASAAGAIPAGHPAVTSTAARLGASATARPPAQSGHADLKVLHGSLPAGWRMVEPSSSMRLAQIAIPRVAGDPEDGELAVFQLGGDVEANLRRWYGQMKQPDGSSTEAAANVTPMFAGGLSMFYAKIPGTFAPGAMGRGEAPAAKPNWMMLGLIVNTPQGLVFLKATGPEATMLANEEKFEAFARTMHVPHGKAAPSAQASLQRSAPIPPHAQIAPEGSSPVPRVPGQTATPGDIVDMQVITGFAPAAWIIETPSSSVRVAQFRLPAAQGDAEDGQLVVYYFGEGQGGSVEDNLDRWFGQMRQPDGSDSAAHAIIEKLDGGPLPGIVAEVAGTYAPGAMPGQAAQGPKENWRLIAAILSTPQGKVFMKATGPEATLAAHRDAIKEFARSARPK